MVDEYEIIPKHEINELKEEIQELKSYVEPNKVVSSSNEKDDLLSAMKELTEVFKQAVAELKKDEKKSDGLSKDEEKIDILIKQNTKIAQGIVALADLLENNLSRLTEGLLQQPKVKYIRIPVQPPQSQHPMPQNTFNQPPQFSNQQYAQNSYGAYPGTNTYMNQRTVTSGQARQNLQPHPLNRNPALSNAQLKNQVIPPPPGQAGGTLKPLNKQPQRRKIIF